jgi:hypothetical protein
VIIQHKLSRETRLAYLLQLLHNRLICGKFVTSSWLKHYRLTNEWHREKVSNEMCGYWSGQVFMKLMSKSNETN